MTFKYLVALRYTEGHSSVGELSVPLLSKYILQ